MSTPHDRYHTRREQPSPDGRLQVHYGSLDGERSPLITEVWVDDAATGATLLDLSGSSLDCTVRFEPYPRLGLHVADPFGPLQFDVAIDLAGGTYCIAGLGNETGRLGQLRETLMQRVDADREERAARFRAAQAQPPKLSPKGRFWSWLFDC